MRKEILIAIIIGLVMGLFITYGYYHSQQTTEVNQITNIEGEKSSDSSLTNLNTGKLTLFSPENETVQADEIVKITGNTTQNSNVIIYVNDTPFITQSDETGNFSKELKLRPLANIINVHSVDSTGEVVVITRTVVVYDQELTLEEQPQIKEEESES